MTQSDFTFWLQGYVEICGARPDETQWLIIKDHLKEVFDKRTPDRTPLTYCGSMQSFQIPTGSNGLVGYVSGPPISC